MAKNKTQNRSNIVINSIKTSKKSASKKKQTKKLMMFGGIRGEEVYCYCSSDFRSQQCSFYNRKGGEQFFFCYKSQKLNSDDCWLLWRNNFKSQNSALLLMEKLSDYSFWVLFWCFFKTQKFTAYFSIYYQSQNFFMLCQP